jgi:heterodisulfide reductase subunit A
MTEGIYIAGCAQGPKDIPATVVQGAAAAARIMGRIQQKEIALEPVRASIDEARCSGCRICNSLCPFNAILFHEDRAVSEVNAALCQGCGTCVAACPAGAISGTGFSNEQILAQLEGILLRNVDGAKKVVAEPVPA